MIRIILFLIIFCNLIFAQDTPFQLVKGSVSYVTPLNIYLKFVSTIGIASGDTVYYKSDGKMLPAVNIKYISSTSCAGVSFKQVKLKVGDTVFAIVHIRNLKSKSISKAGSEYDSNLTKPDDNTGIMSREALAFSEKPNFYGSFSANSFSNFSNYDGIPNLQRWNYVLSLNAQKIGGSNLYFSNYMNMAYLTSQWQDVKSNVFNNLRIYDLSLGYKTKDFTVWIGRHINYNISNIGPTDGIQFEKPLGNFALGGVVGSRPDLYNMGFNFKYFEYGAYIYRTDTAGAGSMQNTLALFQQTYNTKTDRRFLYFQHTNNLFRDIYLFGSSEIDLYKMKNNLSSNDFSLTSLYMSVQYSPLRQLSVNLSYDARKTVVYYQTYKSFIDSLFENEMRQGLRLNFFIRPLTGMFVNLGGGYSYQKGDLKPSRNLNVSVMQTEIPLLLISLTISANRIFGSYQDGAIYSISISKYLPFNSTTITAGFSNVTYNFGNNISKLFQKQVNAQLSTKIINPLFFNVYYEGDFDGHITYSRFMSGINYRF